MALSLSALGCVAEVESGGDGEGGGGGEGGGDTGAECKTYTGAGCKPGETQACHIDMGDSLPPIDGTSVCELVQGCQTQWNYGCNTPLVLSFDGAEVEYTADTVHAFDVNGAASQVTDWPTARTPWLALDRDGSGTIEDGSELFGSMTALRDGGRARNGFLALRELDANGDGRITADDPGFARLSVWSDRDGDRRTGAGELSSAAAWEIVSIDLDYASVPVCDARGNCGVERASFRFRDAAGVVRTGTVIDVRLPAQR